MTPEELREIDLLEEMMDTGITDEQYARYKYLCDKFQCYTGKSADLIPRFHAGESFSFTSAPPSDREPLHC